MSHESRNDEEKNLRAAMERLNDTITAYWACRKDAKGVADDVIHHAPQLLEAMLHAANALATRSESRPLTPLSPENLASRRPLPPEVLAGAMQDKVEMVAGEERTAASIYRPVQAPLSASRDTSLVGLLRRDAMFYGSDAAVGIPADKGTVMGLYQRAADRIEELERCIGSSSEATELTTMRLAAISTASIQNTRESTKERIGRDNPYWSVAYEDVCLAVDREMLQRERVGVAEKICGLYFEIAEEVIGADEVRRRFKERFGRELDAIHDAPLSAIKEPSDG